MSDQTIYPCEDVHALRLRIAELEAENEQLKIDLEIKETAARVANDEVVSFYGLEDDNDKLREQIKDLEKRLCPIWYDCTRCPTVMTRNQQNSDGPAPGAIK